MISSQNPLPQLVQDAQNLIQERYPYLQGATDLAELLQVSSPHLIREFKKATGKTPTQVLLATKLAQSKNLLLAENLYVDTVANLVGFSCGNYFAKVFKKEFSMTPSQYIQENKGKKPQETFPELYL